MKKKPKRKFVVIEVSTTLSNKDLAEEFRLNAAGGYVGDEVLDVVQVHVNAAKKEPEKQ